MGLTKKVFDYNICKPTYNVNENFLGDAKNHYVTIKVLFMLRFIKSLEPCFFYKKKRIRGVFGRKEDFSNFSKTLLGHTIYLSLVNTYGVKVVNIY